MTITIIEQYSFSKTIRIIKWDIHWNQNVKRIVECKNYYYY
jgi:hypothetical protein